MLAERRVVVSAADAERAIQVVLAAREAEYAAAWAGLGPQTRADLRDSRAELAPAQIATHARTAQQSENSLAETLRHELTHHLTGRQLFPGGWLSPGYHAAWALSFYLLTERPAALRQLAAAYRNGSYRLEDWPRLAGAPLAQLESEWHATISGWCGAVGSDALLSRGSIHR